MLREPTVAGIGRLAAMHRGAVIWGGATADQSTASGPASRDRGPSHRPDIQKRADARPYVTRLFRLTLLAPDIVSAILSGRHPPELTARRLMDDTRLPLDWNEQWCFLGFASAV